jgi:Coenzyme PQQ synthesis protein D (PqqD)
MSEACFRVNSPAVIFERFDEEVVAIHLGNGTYHSMSGSASDVFMLLSEEATPGELADALAARYAATPAEIGTALAPFLEQLQEQELIVPVENRNPRDSLRMPGSESRLPFSAPSLRAFNDLEGLLLLDPIHEIGEEGWPPPAAPSRT